MNIISETGFSIVVPTYKEAKNIPSLVTRIAAINFKHEFELLIMDDDSGDGIIDVVNDLKHKCPWLRLIVNKGQRHLSRAIISGIHHAQYPIIVTLDADLSHPPEAIPEMLITLAEPGVEMVIGSRYIKGGSIDATWPHLRTIVSRTALLLAKLLVPVNDPLSGFMAIEKKTCFRGDPLNPIGWKIALELMVKNNCQLIREIPIHFSERTIGKSKLTIKQGVNYLSHIAHLYAYKVIKSVKNTHFSF